MDVDVYIGQIELLPFNFAPRGWQLCDGTILGVVQNQALFALIGNKFGGDGRTTFAVPDLRNATPNTNMAYYIALTGIFPSRS